MNMQKIMPYHNFSSEKKSWFAIPAIWLAKRILVWVSGTRFFPNMGFVQEYSKDFNYRTNSGEINDHICQ